MPCVGAFLAALVALQVRLVTKIEIGPMTTPWLTKIVKSGQFRTLAMFLNLVQIKAGRLLSHLLIYILPPAAMLDAAFDNLSLFIFSQNSQLQCSE